MSHRELIKRQVEECINELIRYHKKNPEIFLTEEDMRSYLYHLLLKYFNELKETADKRHAVRFHKNNDKKLEDIFSIAVHNEVRWYGWEGKLKCRSDIVILQVNDLITNDSALKLPSKGYGFNKFHAIIEVKLRRINDKDDKKFDQRIEHDRKKIRKIRSEVDKKEKDFLSYIIAFDKNRISFVNKSNGNHKEFYISSKDWFYCNPIIGL